MLVLVGRDGMTAKFPLGELSVCELSDFEHLQSLLVRLLPLMPRLSSASTSFTLLMCDEYVVVRYRPCRLGDVLGGQSLSVGALVERVLVSCPGFFQLERKVLRGHNVPSPVDSEPIQV